MQSSENRFLSFYEVFTSLAIMMTLNKIDEASWDLHFEHITLHMSSRICICPPYSQFCVIYIRGYPDFFIWLSVGYSLLQHDWQDTRQMSEKCDNSIVMCSKNMMGWWVSVMKSYESRLVANNKDVSFKMYNNIDDELWKILFKKLKNIKVKATSVNFCQVLFVS